MISRWIGGALTRIERRRRRRRRVKRSKFVAQPVQEPPKAPPESSFVKTQADMRKAGVSVTTPPLKPQFNKSPQPRP